jgi:hypothetical protein
VEEKLSGRSSCLDLCTLYLITVDKGYFGFMQRPTNADFFQFARYFLWVAEQAKYSNESDLLAALDGLAFTYHYLPEVEVATASLEPPDLGEYQVRYSAMGKRFPELGYYACLDTLELHEREVGISDAIDDLVDIAAEMHAILWYLDNAKLDDALGRTHEMRYHWLGEHLRPFVCHLEQRHYVQDTARLGPDIVRNS